MGAETIAAPVLNSRSSDDEILGLTTHLPRKIVRRGSDDSSGGSTPRNDEQLDLEFGAGDERSGDRVAREDGRGEPRDGTDATRRTAENLTAQDVPTNLQKAFGANPELRDAWRDVNEYRETYATPAEARAATALLGDLNRMDALFYSRRPEDHAELARAVAQLDPAAFASSAREMGDLASGRAEQSNEVREPARVSESQPTRREEQANQGIRQDARPESRQENTARCGLTEPQAEFFHATNAAAVQSVLDPIETQVERLLPEGIAKSARNRVVGEIYREIDVTLRGNRALGQQMREAFRSGALDEDHRRAIVSLVMGRARQALPAVAKRILDEWTTTVVSANHARRARQRTAERRVDIAGSGGAGNDARRAVSSRDIDYARMSDADILNL
ncbi:MAG: hypothetical protein WA197_12690 [Candidatus Acidiferrales bacterium]